MTERQEFQRAEAETVMFASLRPAAWEEPASQAPRAQTLAPDRRRGRHRTGEISAGDAAPQSVASPRRRWLSRGVLLLILIMQAVLTLRTHNTAFEDESLYLYVGHLEIAHWLHDVSLQGDYPSYFSGAPVLYPVLGAVADGIGGVTAARALSLVEMLGATALIYAMSRRLFNERTGLCSALIFSVSESTLFLGNFATYDASALFLLTLAVWVVVRTADSRWPVYLLAAPIAVLAIATKYASLLFVPSMVALVGLVAWPRAAWKAVIRPIALAAAILGLTAAGLYLAGPDYLKGIDVTTLQRSDGNVPATSLLWSCVQWIGVPFGLAVIGAVAYTVRPATETRQQIASAGSRLRRATLGAVLAGSALLAPAEQIRIHTFVALQKHVGFGLLYAAPIAGVGLARIIGDHFRRAQVGIAIWGAGMVLGMTQASTLFTSWPNSTVFVADITRYLQPRAHYLVEVPEVPIYYLRNNAEGQPDQFTSTYYIGYVNTKGQYLTGDAGYTAAIKAGYFRIVAYNDLTTPAVDGVIAHTLAADPDYRLADSVPLSDGATEYIWVKDS